MQVEQRRNFIVAAFDTLTPITARLNRDEKILYSAKLEALRKRFYDPEFRLAVAGNFSCGKSTFLNALLKRKLLTTDILPTTAIPTYIRWNKEDLLNQTRRDARKYCNPIITLTMTDGKIYTLTRAGKVDFKRETMIHLPDGTGEIIDTLTTTNELINKILRVDLTFPERRGFENFCLIDTPGINPGGEESKEHILQTQKVLREDADAVIVLYSAKDAMTRDTEEFMRDNAGHLMAGAIIVLTKMDLVPTRQVDKVIKNTARLVKERFKQNEPKIYPISAQQAIDYFSGESADPKDLQAADDFNRVLDEIITQLGERRSEIVSRRISDLMRDLLDSISSAVSSDLEDLEKKRALLKKAAADNLEEDFGKLNQAYKDETLKKINANHQTLKTTIRTIIRNRRESIFKKINGAKNSAELNQCLKNFYPMIMADVEQKILDELNRRIIATWNQSSKDYAKKVAECLGRYEKYLGEVNTQAAVTKNKNEFQISTAPPSAKDESFLNDCAGKISGTILDVFSRIIDVFSLGSKKESAKQKVRQKLEEYESELLTACNECIAQTEKENLAWARNLLEKYRENYQTLFDEIELRHNEHVTAIEAQIVRNKKDIRRIKDLKEMSTEI